MSFYIGFTGSKQCESADEEVSLEGTVVIGSFKESFVAPTSYWHKQTYECHWRDALLRIIRGQERSALITSMRDPTIANFIAWWPMYLVGKQVVIQNQLLFLNEVCSDFDEKDLFQYVTARRVVSEDGDQISEWTVDVKEVRHFLDQWERKLHFPKRNGDIAD